MAKFNSYVSVYKDPAEFVTFAPGDEVPKWALDKVGDHVLEGNEDDSVDVRLTDPHYEDDDPETQFQTPTTLPVETGGTVEDVVDEDEYSSLSKEQLKELAEERGLAKSGNKEELLARLREDDDAEDDDEE